MGYIIKFSNVSSQGEQCMMSLMVDLIILVICISDSASGVKKRQEQKVKLQEEMKV